MDQASRHSFIPILNPVKQDDGFVVLMLPDSNFWMGTSWLILNAKEKSAIV